jgi:hypothetical protein
MKEGKKTEETGTPFLRSEQKEMLRKLKEKLENTKESEKPNLARMIAALEDTISKS